MADADPVIDRTGARPAAFGTVEPAVPVRARRRWRLVLMLAVPLLILVAGAYLYLTSGRYVSTDNAYVQQDVVSISPDVTGRIVDVRVRENQVVRAGDVLFVIDPEPYRIALEQADAAVAEARVDVGTKATDTGTASADIEKARADIQLAQATFDRQAALMKQGFTTRASLDAAQHELAASHASLAIAQATAAHARAQLASGTGGSGNPAAIQAAIAARDRAALNLQRTAVRATVDGTVSQTGRLQVGNITPTGIPALSLVSAKAAWISANFKETDLNHMAVGQCATLSFDAYPGLKVRGRVQSIGAGTGSEFSILPAQNATGNWVKVTQRVPVRIAVDGKPSRPMIAGLSSSVSIDTRARCG